MMLGHMANAGTMYRSNEPALVPDDRDLVGRAARSSGCVAARNLPRAEQTTSRRRVAAEPIIAPDDVKENAFTLHDGVIAIRTGATLTPIANLPDETARRIRGLDQSARCRARSAAHATR